MSKYFSLLNGAKPLLNWVNSLEFEYLQAENATF